MGLVNRQVPALFNGISQQPDTTRLPSQAEEQINFYGTVVDGLRRRPPSEHVAKLSANDLSSARLHLINRDATERYIVVVTNGNIQVFDMDGTEQTVTFPGRATFQASHAYSSVGTTVRPTTPNGFIYKVTLAGTSGTEPSWPTTLGATVNSGSVQFTCVPDYLGCSDARSQFSCTTVADYTFILNKSVVVALEAAGRDQVSDPPAYYWLNRDGMSNEYEQRTAVRQQYPANAAGVTYRGMKQSFEDLPETPAEGDLWEIQGTVDSAFQTYYVVRKEGVWNETVKPGIQNKIDACTMPHALVRLADGTFEFAPFSWNPRRVGDDNTNKHPSFVGRTISDIFFYKNRLGLATGEGAVMSRAGDFGTYHRLTVMQLLDDERIDMAASETKVTNINHAVPFDAGMMLFADQVQFKLKHGDVLTPTTVSPDVATQYEMVSDARPDAVGSDVYFASQDGDYAKLYEYYVRKDVDGTDASDVTGHVPKFIPSGVSQIVGSSKQDAVFVLTNGAVNRSYVYKFYWASETEKAQSSWSYWQFASDDKLLSLSTLDNTLVQVVSRSDGTYLEKLALESGAHAPGLSIQIFLDRRVVVTGVWLEVEDVTEFTLPYPVAEADRASFRIVRGATFGAAKGALIPKESFTWVSSTVVRVAGNWAGTGICGLRYESRYTFSKQYMRNANDVAITSGSLILIGYSISYKDTAYFRTEVAPYGVGPDIEEIIPSRISEFDGKTLGENYLTLGAPVLSKGTYYFQVHGDAAVATVTLVNDSPYASTFTQAEWEGNYDTRSRTV